MKNICLRTLVILINDVSDKRQNQLIFSPINKLFFLYRHRHFSLPESLGYFWNKSTVAEKDSDIPILYRFQDIFFIIILITIDHTVPGVHNLLYFLADGDVIILLSS